MRTRLRSAAFAMAALAGVQTVAGHQQTVFRSKVEAVRVDVLVTDRGRPVGGLTAGDFEVLDNGVPQRVTLGTATGPVSVVLVLDRSGSMEGDKLRSVVAAGERLVDALRPGDSASLISFSEHLSLQVAPVRDTAAVRTALTNARPRGMTAMWDALFAGLSQVAAQPGRSLVLLMTDGADNASYLTDEQMIEAVKRSEAVVDVVVTGRSAGLIDWLYPLKRVASDSGGRFLIADWRTRLPQAFVEALDEFRARYLLLYEPAGVKRDDGWHTLRVRLKGKKGKVSARPGYFAKGS